MKNPRWRSRCSTGAGKLLPRERLGRLLDPGAPFLELSPLAGYGMYGDTDGSLCGGNLIAGIGFVSGLRCLAVAWNYAIKGGTITRVTTQKMLRLQEIARRQRLPIVSLSESGGGNLEGGGGSDPWGAFAFIEGGLCYAQQAELSAAGIPQVVVAHGNATAGGAYHVALCDYVVLVRGRTQLFLAGPPLLQGGDRRDRRQRGARRRRDARARLRYGRVPGRGRRGRHRDRARDRSPAAATAGSDAGPTRRAAALRPRGARRRGAARSPQDLLRHARGDRAHRRRLALPRVRARHRPGDTLCGHATSAATARA